MDFTCLGKRKKESGECRLIFHNSWSTNAKETGGRRKRLGTLGKPPLRGSRYQGRNDQVLTLNRKEIKKHPSSKFGGVLKEEKERYPGGEGSGGAKQKDVEKKKGKSFNLRGFITVKFFKGVQQSPQ